MKTDTKSNIISSPDANATRFDLNPLYESDFSPSDPSGNQRAEQRPIPICKWQEFSSGAWMKQNREDSMPSDKRSTAVEEVTLADTDEVASRQS